MGTFKRIIPVVFLSLACGLFGCTQSKELKNIEPYLEAGFRPISSTVDYAYAFKIAPGQSVNIVLPALCLNYSKDTPSTTAQFSARPVAVDRYVQQLLTLHRLMTDNLPVFTYYFRQLPDLNFLTLEAHTIETNDGTVETIRYPLKTALDEALQRAIWQNDRAAQSDWDVLHRRRAKQIRHIRSLRESLDAGSPVDRVMDQIHQSELKLDNQANLIAADDLSRNALGNILELSIARFELAKQWDTAVERLGRIMYQTVQGENKLP
ncbi:MAG: hypothetical protein JRH15_01125 [Deltaproteobacteria bacterium]|nr:hypothetical protein [Deltaproteobacteria bacterium]